MKVKMNLNYKKEGKCMQRRYKILLIIFGIFIMLIFMGADCIEQELFCPECNCPPEYYGVFFVSSDGVEGRLYVDNEFFGDLHPHGTLKAYIIPGQHTIYLNQHKCAIVNITHNNQKFYINGNYYIWEEN